MLSVRRFVCLFLFVGLLAAGCGAEEGAPRGAPEGWQAAGPYWWKAGVDTAQAFRNLASLEAMGVSEGAGYASAGGQISDDQFATGVKRSLLPLFRADPERVDSLFEQYVRPKALNAKRTGDARQDVKAFRSEAYGALRRHFRGPQTTLRLGEDIAVAYPDSLRRAGVSGRVRMQVRVSAEGAPQAVELLEGVHPTLSDIARRATTQMRWTPARMRSASGHAWTKLPAWVRFNVSFRPPA